jgi:hypothetical protein
MTPIWPVNLADVSDWLPLDEVTIWQIGSIVVVERLPDEDDENAPGPVVTGANVPFSGNVVGGGIGLQLPAMQCTEATNDIPTMPMLKSTDRPPELDLWIAEAGTRAVALVEIMSGGSGGGTTGHGSGGGVDPPYIVVYQYTLYISWLLPGRATGVM